MNESALRVLGYVRASTAEQEITLDAQRSRIRAWADLNGAEVVDVVEDAGESGSKPLAQRPGGARIAALLAARTNHLEADAVVVVALDRLGRDTAEQIALLKRFRTGRVGIVAINNQVDLATPMGRAMAKMAAVWAELERELIGQRTAAALGELRDQRRIYGPTPFGFRREGEGREARLVPEAAEQATLARIRELRAGDAGYDRVARQLNAEGRPTKRGGQWAAMSVRSVLRTAEKLAV